MPKRKSIDPCDNLYSLDFKGKLKCLSTHNRSLYNKLKYLRILKMFSIIKIFTDPITDIDNNNKCSKLIQDYPKLTVNNNGNEVNVVEFENENYTICGTIGSVYSRKPMCRVIYNSDKKNIVVVFRPFDISNLDEITMKSWVLSYLNKTLWTSSQRKSVKDNTDLVYRGPDPLYTVSNMFLDNDIIMNDGIGYKKGDYELLDMSYPYCDYITKKSGNVNNMLNGILKIIESIIYKSEVRLIEFTGYSLGAGMASCAAVMIHRKLKNKNFPFSVVSCCGGPAGNDSFVNYIEREFKENINVVVNNDMVSQVTGNLKNFYPTCFISYKDGGSIFCKDIRYDHKKDMKTFISDATTYFKNPASRTNFKTYHLSGEDVVPLIILKQFTINDLELLYKYQILDFNKVSGTENINLENFCKLYNKSYALKFKICPSNSCRYVTLYSQSGKEMGVCKKTEQPIFTGKQIKKVKLRFENIKDCYKVFDAYKATMNNLSIKTDIIERIFNEKKGKNWSQALYIGSYLTYPKGNKSLSSFHGDTTDGKDFEDVVNKLSNDIKYAFKKPKRYICFILGAITSTKDLSHHIGFIYDKENNILKKFDPGMRSWGPQSAQEVENVINEIFTNAKTRRIQAMSDNKWACISCSVGPQDTCRGGLVDELHSLISTHKSVHRESFCQTWSILLILNQIENIDSFGYSLMKEWKSMSKNELELCIRRFILWIVSKNHRYFQYTYKNDYKGKEKYYIDELLACMQNFNNNIYIPKSGEYICDPNINLR